MSEESSPLVLKRLVSEIEKTQELLDASITLTKSLESVSFNCTQNHDEVIERTKGIIDQLKEKVISLDNYFYQHYNIWKNKKETAHNNQSRSECPECNQTELQESTVIEDNIDIDTDNINNDRLIENTAVDLNLDKEPSHSSDKVTNIPKDTISLEEKDINTAVDLNLDKETSQSSDEVINIPKDTILQEEKDINTAVDLNLDKETSQSSDEVTDIPKDTISQEEKDISKDCEDNISENVNNNTVSNQNLNNEIRTTHNSEQENIECEPQANSNDENSEAISISKDENGQIINVTHIVDNVNSKKECDISNKKDYSTDNTDPLDIDSNLITNDSNSTNMCDNEETFKLNSDATIKHENTIKIKCVDIKKLLDPAAVSCDIANSSIVIISDSDNESSPKKQTKKCNSKTATSLKKVVILDDSDNSDSIVNNKKKNESNKFAKNKENPNLSNSNSKKSSKETVNHDDKSQRNTRRKLTHDLIDVSSLSENSNTSSDDTIARRKKKTKSRSKIVNSGNVSLLKPLQDKKFVCKTYVPLTRIPAEKLKENYKKKLMKTEIKRLTNLKSLKRSRQKCTESSDSPGSNATKKKRQCTKKKKKVENSDSSASDVSMCESRKSHDEHLFDVLRNPTNKTASTAEALLGGINSDDANSDTNSEPESKTSGKENGKKKNKEKDNKSKANRKESDDDRDTKAMKERQKWRKDKLLTENITESDSEENFAKFMKKKDKLEEKKSDTEEATLKKSTKRLHRRKAKNVLGSDSDSSLSAKNKSDSSGKKTDSSESEKSSDSEKNKKQPKRRRIRKMKDSSDNEEGEDKSTRKNIRKVWKKNTLAETTIAAEKEEQERKARITEKQKKYNRIFEPDSLEKATVDKVVLDFNDETKEELLSVDPRIVKHLKPHQAKGIQFMWNASFESLERTQKTKGSGCVLAHCMGLGKTLQVIALVHTLITNQETIGIKKVLIVCPLNTVLNWVAEFKKWLPDDDDVEVFELVSFKSNYERMYQISEWDRIGGALILGYDLFRNLTSSTNKRLSKKMRNKFHTCLLEPGPQLVICDEGHLLKNEKTSLSIAMNRLQTLRRIVLTGTPLQNNLKEYFCMVQFVKPNLLGTYKEYLNRFVNPIINGQYTDSTPHDIQIMRKRSHVLHKMLDGIVQRNDYSVLAPFLPPKHEYVLFVSLTELQIKLYKHYLAEKSGCKSGNAGRSFLFVDFYEFQRICTHPRVLLDKSTQLKQSKDKMDYLDDESEGSLKNFIDDDEETEQSSSSTSSEKSDSESDGSCKKNKKKPSSKQRITRATAGLYEISDKENSDTEKDPSEWWRQYCQDDDLDNIAHGGKLYLLFEIIRQCEIIGDKILIFSQSLYSLNVIEYFLNKIDEATQNSETSSFCGFSGSWSVGLDYFRLDGSSSCDNRAAWCKTFNDSENIRARLFLISTKAGGLGINLFAANRVIIFDVSWNPSHDTQSIYRVYRFGQTKPSYIYRFVTFGTMEMKVYERQVTKQAISKRVIDEQQIDRHYNQNDLAELYNFDPGSEEDRPIPLVPKDVLLGELLQMDKKIYKYHEHQSLLENKIDEVLDEEERKAAWEEFENEKKARTSSGMINNVPMQSLAIALRSIIQKENPGLGDHALSLATAAMLKKLQEEVETGTSPLFYTACEEMRRLEQERINQYYRMQQQRQAFMQYRHQFYNNQQNLYNNMDTTPMHNYPRQGVPSAASFSQNLLQNQPVDFIELND